MKRAFLLSSILGIALAACGVQGQYTPPPPYGGGWLYNVPSVTNPTFNLSAPHLTDPGSVPLGLGPPVTDLKTPPPGSSFVDLKAGSDKDRLPWDLSDPEIKAAHKAWTLAFMNREAEKFTEHKRAFTETGSMSVAVFWTAHILLAGAIIAASFEFVRAQRVRKVATEMQELRVSLEGVALKTSLHGTLLLVIAMSFYYLFLKFVYPITVVGG